eukprot:353445-Chlamydomonas_euryale.AAC.21
MARAGCIGIRRAGSGAAVRRPRSDGAEAAPAARHVRIADAMTMAVPGDSDAAVDVSWPATPITGHTLQVWAC